MPNELLNDFSRTTTPGGGVPEHGLRVLIVDDDPAMRALVHRSVLPGASSIKHAGDGETALSLLKNNETDVVILDLELPRMNGLEVLLRVRRDLDTPVIILSGRVDESDRVLGLDLGADDYIVKPFLPRELLSRVRAVTRRAGQGRDKRSQPLVFGPLVIDRDTREVRNAGGVVALTAKEFDLLCFLASSPRRVFSREDLLEGVWGSSAKWQDPATVTEHVRRVRNRLEEAGGSGAWLRTVRSQGYAFTPAALPSQAPTLHGSEAFVA